MKPEKPKPEIQTLLQKGIKSVSTASGEIVYLKYLKRRTKSILYTSVSFSAVNEVRKVTCKLKPYWR